MGLRGHGTREKHRVLYFQATMNSKLPVLGGRPETQEGSFLGGCGGRGRQSQSLTGKVLHLPASHRETASAFQTEAGAPPQPSAHKAFPVPAPDSAPRAGRA